MTLISKSGKSKGERESKYIKMVSKRLSVRQSCGSLHEIDANINLLVQLKEILNKLPNHTTSSNNDANLSLTGCSVRHASEKRQWSDDFSHEQYDLHASEKCQVSDDFSREGYDSHANLCLPTHINCCAFIFFHQTPVLSRLRIASGERKALLHTRNGASCKTPPPKLGGGCSIGLDRSHGNC